MLKNLVQVAKNLQKQRFKMTLRALAAERRAEVFTGAVDKFETITAELRRENEALKSELEENEEKRLQAENVVSENDIELRRAKKLANMARMAAIKSESEANINRVQNCEMSVKIGKLRRILHSLTAKAIKKSLTLNVRQRRKFQAHHSTRSYGSMGVYAQRRLRADFYNQMAVFLGCDAFEKEEGVRRINLFLSDLQIPVEVCFCIFFTFFITLGCTFELFCLNL